MRLCKLLGLLSLGLGFNHSNLVSFVASGLVPRQSILSHTKSSDALSAFGRLTPFLLPAVLRLLFLGVLVLEEDKDEGDVDALHFAWTSRWWRPVYLAALLSALLLCFSAGVVVLLLLAARFGQV